MSGLRVRSDFAMTGEVTLRGKVLAVGGISEDRTLAAYRAGIKHVVLPKANEKDLVEIPDEVHKGMTFHPIERMDTLLELALIGYDPKTDLNDHLPVDAELDGDIADVSG